jgi:hypothetical protein
LGTWPQASVSGNRDEVPSAGACGTGAAGIGLVALTLNVTTLDGALRTPSASTASTRAW